MATYTVEQIYDTYVKPLGTSDREKLVKITREELDRAKNLFSTTTEPEPSLPDTPTPKKRILGLHLGSVWMSDDFNAELPDSFWLGEE